MSSQIEKFVGKCPTCQKSKKGTIKYGKLPVKDAEVDPWDVLCVDLIGPYKITRKHLPKGKRELVLHCLTMIDPATGWFEIVPIADKTSMEVANEAELAWFTRYPWPTTIIFDRGSEFMGEFARMCLEDYGLKRKPITTRNPQANAIVERVHQTVGNMIRTLQVQNSDEPDPWRGVLAAVGFAVRSTYHTTLRATPAQLVFGRDSILNIRHEADWIYIQHKKQQRIKANNARENAKRKEYQYKVNDQVLVTNPDNRKYGSDPYIGPYKVLEVRNNGTVRLEQDMGHGSVQQTWNIRQLKPFKA
jgi:hypothetical protein